MASNASIPPDPLRMLARWETVVWETGAWETGAWETGAWAMVVWPMAARATQGLQTRERPS